MSSFEKKDWDRFLTENYDDLVRSAEFFTDDSHDLVHHTYLRAIKYGREVTSPKTYFKRAMFIEATRGEFKKEYTLKDAPKYIHISDYDLSEAFLKEEFLLASDRLSWFERVVLQLYLDGWNLTQVARESGIKSCVFHTCLHRSREKLKKFFTTSEHPIDKGNSTNSKF